MQNRASSFSLSNHAFVSLAPNLCTSSRVLFDRFLWCVEPKAYDEAGQWIFRTATSLQLHAKSVHEGHHVTYGHSSGTGMCFSILLSELKVLAGHC